MAQRTVLIDDMDGEEADATVSFSLEGNRYEIDLRQSNIQLLREALAPFVKAARQAASQPASSPTRQRRKRPSDSKIIRAWAEANGIAVPRRGRIPVSVVAQYERAS